MHRFFQWIFTKLESSVSDEVKILLLTALSKVNAYHKHRRISHTFLLKSFVSNRGCGLSVRTSVHHVLNLHKLTLFSENFTTLLKELLTSLMLPFLSRWTSLGRESSFRHKVVYSVDNGCSLWQKSIHHERENTMLFLSIGVVNGRAFLCCSIVWRQTCCYVNSLCWFCVFIEL